MMFDFVSRTSVQRRLYDMLKERHQSISTCRPIPTAPWRTSRASRATAAGSLVSCRTPSAPCASRSCRIGRIFASSMYAKASRCLWKVRGSNSLEMRYTTLYEQTTRRHFDGLGFGPCGHVGSGEGLGGVWHRLGGAHALGPPHAGSGRCICAEKRGGGG